MKEIKIIAKFRKINFHLENKFRFETVGRDNDSENSKKTELVLQKRNSKRKIEEWNLDLFACRGTCSIQGNGMRKGDSELGNQKRGIRNPKSGGMTGKNDGIWIFVVLGRTESRISVSWLRNSFVAVVDLVQSRREIYLVW
jgi:hypothetical protein